ncbi:MAG: ABC transporter ATP-binding protein [Elusimicrobia bacterium]|nr:ABC transporter ATP-binding protein [Elusimicrobiota bacterium]
MLTSLSIEVTDVYKKLGPNQALAGVTLCLEEGGLYGVIGPDGAGKTTLLRTIMGLFHPDEGRVAFRIENKAASFDQARPLIAYMPQQQSLYPDLSIKEHLEFFRDLYQISDDVYTARRQRLLRLTRLEKFEDRPAGQLSGGMYKKLGLMCALLQTPSALLLDEPTNGVDPISRREFWDLLYELRGEGILILMATAYMDEAERCGEVHLMEAGRIWTYGPPRTILEKEKARDFAELFVRRAEGSQGK